MDTRSNYRSQTPELTGFGGSWDDFADLYWEMDTRADQRAARSRRTTPTLTSQIEDILRRNF